MYRYTGGFLCSLCSPSVAKCQIFGNRATEKLIVCDNSDNQERSVSAVDEVYVGVDIDAVTVPVSFAVAVSIAIAITNRSFS